MKIFNLGNVVKCIHPFYYSLNSIFYYIFSAEVITANVQISVGNSENDSDPLKIQLNTVFIFITT